MQTAERSPGSPIIDPTRNPGRPPLGVVDTPIGIPSDASFTAHELAACVTHTWSLWGCLISLAIAVVVAAFHVLIFGG